MRAIKYEISESMIEGAGIEIDNGRVTAFMIRMTGRALIGVSSGVQSVKSCLCFDVSGNLVVTIHAALSLGFLIKHHVA